MTKDYTYKGTGTNSEGNHYCTRSDNATGRHAYHYSNQNSSYYYANSDGSTYYNDGQGSSKYTSPTGHTTTSTGK